MIVQNVGKMIVEEGLKVLHLEDNPIDAELVRIELEDSFPRLEYRHVENRADYSQAITVENYHLILADYHVPGFSGMEILEVALTYGTDAPIIFVSGAIGEERAMDVLRGGATDYVVKQNLNKLSLAINRALSEKQKKVEKEKVEESLKETNKELNTFVYKSSHDLRSPLATTLGLVNLALNEVKDKTALDYIHLIKKSALKLDGILEDLTQLTIIRQGEVELSSIKIKPFIDEILSAFSLHPNFNGIEFQIIDKLNKPVVSDSRLLKTILRNLIENAIKYRRPTEKNANVNIEVGSSASNLKIVISDNGIGIPEEYQDKIFEMFFRATETSQGSGLGLYIVKSAVEKLDGYAEVESDEKKGTIFNIYLPKQQIQKP